MENYAATGAGRSGDQALKNACRIRRTFPRPGQQLLHASDPRQPPSPAVARGPRPACGGAGAALRGPWCARPSFRFWETGGDWLRAIGPAPAGPPPPARGVGSADAGTLGLGSGEERPKAEASCTAPAPASRASARDRGASGRGAGEARARLGPERALCSAKCQLRADRLGAHLPAGQSAGI